MTNRAISLALFFLSGCFTQYATVAELTPEHKIAFGKVEAYYLGKGKEQAAFSLSCPPEQLTATIVSTRPGSVSALDSMKRWVYVMQGTIITAIGTEGCGRRAAYQVLCGPRQEYGDIEAITARAPCDVIPSSDAVQAVEKNQREQQELIDQAARQQQQEKQHSK